MKKKLLIILAIILGVTAITVGSIFGIKAVEGKRTNALISAITEGGEYSLEHNTGLTSTGIEHDLNIDAKGHTIKAKTEDWNAIIFQNIYANSSFSNATFRGLTKPDVGIWVGSGVMSFKDCEIKKFDITDGRMAAIGVDGSSVLNLENTAFSKNSYFDIALYGIANVNIFDGTEINSIRFGSRYAKINLKAGWSGKFEITMDNPTARLIGTAEEGVDISNITISNDGFILENVDGKLYVRKQNETSLRFDMEKRETLYKGSTGFLYGASEINVPSIDLLQGLKPDTMVQKAVGGLQHPTGDAVRASSALLSAGVRDMQIYIQDNYLEWPYDAPMKGDAVDVDEYQKTVEKIVNQMICDENGKVNTAFAEKYSFVLFNEPDQIWFGGNLEGLEQAWKQIYSAVKNIYPDARCVGPNFSGFNEESYDAFLSYCKDNNCLPEIISWHELGDVSLTDFEDHYNSVQDMVKKYYSSENEPELMVNEYARHYDIGSVGGLVKWLAMFENKDMSGCMAYWAMANSLNEMAADQNSPASTWWVYHWYAQMTGEQCPITYPNFKDSKFYGVASYDENENMGYILFGGSEDDNYTETVYADNISKTDLMNKNGAVNVKIYGVGFSGQHGASYKPELIFNGAVQTKDNSLEISVEETDEMDAYFAVLTKPSDDAEVKEFGNAKISTISYEAENATLLGNSATYPKLGWTDFATSGRSDVGSINNNESGVQFDVEVAEEGIYNASIFYSLQAPFVNPQTLEPQEDGQNRGIGKSLPYGVAVDGVELDNIILESTVTWAYKNHADVEIPLNAGKHTITYHHINGDEAEKGNLQLTAAIDKLDLTKVDVNSKNDFEIDLTEMASFKTANGYKVTAVAPTAGYYKVVANGNVSLTKQAIDYAKDAKTISACKVYDIPVGNTVYLSQGANTIGVVGNATKLEFKKVNAKEQTISSSQMKLSGKATYKANSFAISNKVVSNIANGESNSAYINVNADKDGYYNLAIRYTNDEPAPVMLKANGETYVHPYNIDLVERYAQIEVNGSEPETVYFRNTLSWDTFKAVDVQVKLKKGTNRIKIYNDNSYHFSPIVDSTAPEIDQITISQLSY